MLKKYWVIAIVIFLWQNLRKNGHNSTNMVDRVMWLAAVVYIVIRNKYAKFEVNLFDGIEDISICKIL